MVFSKASLFDVGFGMWSYGHCSKMMIDTLEEYYFYENANVASHDLTWSGAIYGLICDDRIGWVPRTEFKRTSGRCIVYNHWSLHSITCNKCHLFSEIAIKSFPLSQTIKPNEFEPSNRPSVV
jgi:hypothetical protein